MQFRAGRIDLINTAPIYFGADTGRVDLPGCAVSGSPAELNLLLRQNQLQISAISSVEFAYSHPDLLILPGISISSTGPVRSVLLYSKCPLAELNGRVGLSIRSASARALVRILLEDFHERQVEYRDVDIAREFFNQPVRSRPRDLDGLLVIGNDALALDLQESFPHVLDLGEFWVNRTGHPFVFGIWAARKDFAGEHPDLVDAYCSCLLRSLALGLREIDSTVALAAERSGVSEERIRHYLERIDYVLGPQHLAGLAHFFDLLKRRGEIDAAVELEFYERPRERASHA
jgi:chorismate dehydratase